MPFLMIEAGYYFGEIDFVYAKYKNLYENNKDLVIGDAQADLAEHKTGGPLRRAFSVKALGPRACDILTLSKQDLQKVEAEFEEMVSEMFLNSYKKIRKILRIKDEAENQYLMK